MQQIDIRIALWNANGIANHINEFEMFMLISESHCTSRSNIKISGYNVILSNHPSDMSYAGAAIII